MESSSTFRTAGFLALLLILCAPILVAAQAEKEDVVYLKNGSILRGEIIERSSNGRLKIQTVGRNVLVVELEEVEKIGREEIPTSSAPQHYKSEGYFNTTGIGMLRGGDETTAAFQMINGYRFSSRFAAGLGIGFTPYSDPLSLLPVFLNANFKFLEANTSPFVSLSAGYNFSILSDEDTQIDAHRGGFMLNPGIGLEFSTSSGLGWYVSAGLKIDNSVFEEETWNGRIMETDINYRRLQMGLGFTF